MDLHLPSGPLVVARDEEEKEEIERKEKGIVRKRGRKDDGWLGQLSQPGEFVCAGVYVCTCVRVFFVPDCIARFYACCVFNERVCAGPACLSASVRRRSGSSCTFVLIYCW